jgi:hypothetical protein
MDVPAEEFLAMKAEAKLFPELMAATGTLTSIEAMEGSDAYVVENGKTTTYFDVKSGLKVAESKTQEQGGQQMTNTTYFKDYQDVKGVKFPFNIVMNAGFELDVKLTEIKINEGVTDADFK